VLVDEGLRALHTEHVFAVGDCAQPGERAPSGLIAQGWQQADWLAARFRSEFLGEAAPAPLGPERSPVILLKARGVNLAVAGEVGVDPWDTFSPENAPAASGPPPLQVSLWSDPEHGAYVKMATRAGVLVGFVALGMPRAAAELTLLFESGAELPADRSVILRLDGPEAALAGGPSASAAPDPEAMLCRCAGVSRGRVQEAVGTGCSTVEEVSRRTRAGTGCGGCRDGVRELIEEHFAAAAA
jgi:assimilatory nitrate reductase electron transfer subunit